MKIKSVLTDARRLIRRQAQQTPFSPGSVPLETSYNQNPFAQAQDSAEARTASNHGHYGVLHGVNGKGRNCTQRIHPTSLTPLILPSFDFKPGVVGPVYTFVKTDYHGNVQLGRRHVVGKKYGRR